MGGGIVKSVEGEEFGAEAAVLWCSSAHCDLSKHLVSHSDHLWSFCEKVQFGGSWYSKICQLISQLHWSGGAEGKAVFEEQYL